MSVKRITAKRKIYNNLGHKEHSTLISNFRRVLEVVCFLLGDFPASDHFQAKPFSV